MRPAPQLGQKPRRLQLTLPDARGCSSRSAHAENRSQVDHTPSSPRTRLALRAVAESDPPHSAVSEIQANTALPELIQQCPFWLMPHMGGRDTDILSGCGSAIKRILASFD